MGIGILKDCKTEKTYFIGHSTMIGIDASGSIVLNNYANQEVNAYINFSDGSWYITDMGSAGGVQVDNKKIFPHFKTPLKPGCTLQFGHYIMKFSVQEDNLTQNQTLDKAAVVSKTVDHYETSKTENSSKPLNQKKKLTNVLFTIIVIAVSVSSAYMLRREAKINPHGQQFAEANAYFTGKRTSVDGSNNYENALKKYKICIENKQAMINAEILQLLFDGQYQNAAELVNRALREDQTNLSRENWITCFEKCVQYNENDLKEWLKNKYILLSVNKKTDNPSYEFPNTEPEYSGVLYGIIPPYVAVEDIYKLYEECAQQPDGKILIIMEYTDYKKTDAFLIPKEYAVAKDLMEQLPLLYFPESLDQVEYIVLVTYNSEKKGYYRENKDTESSSILDLISNGFSLALRENAKVQVLHFPEGNKMFKSDIIYGEEPPETVSEKGRLFKSFYSGGSPEVGKIIQEAINIIIDKER